LDRKITRQLSVTMDKPPGKQPRMLPSEAD
jgi:hypothetical protein